MSLDDFYFSVLTRGYTQKTRGLFLEVEPLTFRLIVQMLCLLSHKRLVGDALLTRAYAKILI